MHQSRQTPAVIVAATVLFLGGCSAADMQPEPVTASNSATPEPGSTAHSAPSETATVVATPELTTYTTADGMFAFDHPSDWSVVVTEPAQLSISVPLSLIVHDAEGREMATLVAGFPAANDSVVTGPIEPVPLEYQKIPEEQLATTYEGTAIAFHYETRFNPTSGEVGAAMGIDTFKKTFPISSSLPGFHIDSMTGAAFSRWIDTSDAISGIGPNSKVVGGTELYEAYQRTDEYQNAKKMMVSLRRLS